MWPGYKSAWVRLEKGDSNRPLAKLLRLATVRCKSPGEPAGRGACRLRVCLAVLLNATHAFGAAAQQFEGDQ